MEYGVDIQKDLIVVGGFAHRYGVKSSGAD